MASTDIGYEQWHDGIGYDLEALGELEGGERHDAEQWLLARAGKDWRDLEGLLAIGSDRARAAVVDQLRHGELEQRLSAARYLADDPALAAEREASIIAGLGSATVLSGLSTALDLAEAYPTSAVLDALFRAALRDDREMATHAAALLLFLHGKAEEPFDWDRRPFFLQFGEADPAIRRAAFEQLCHECGVDPKPYLRG